jgi:hypothetical protein
MPSGSIRRSDVFSIAKESDPVLLFVAVMAWGTGTTGYGWWRAANIARPCDEKSFTSRLQRQIEAARVSPGAAWRAWRGGESALRNFNTAFASKLAYFAGSDEVTGGGGPLIADRRTSWAAWAFARELNNTRTQGAKYELYVQKLHDWAEGIRPDSIEYALFLLGPSVIRGWADGPFEFELPTEPTN